MAACNSMIFESEAEAYLQALSTRLNTICSMANGSLESRVERAREFGVDNQLHAGLARAGDNRACIRSSKLPTENRSRADARGPRSSLA